MTRYLHGTHSIDLCPLRIGVFSSDDSGKLVFSVAQSLCIHIQYVEL